MATFLEGVESITLACSLVVIGPALLAVLLVRHRRAVVALGVIVGIATMMWARAGRIWDVASTGRRTIVIGLVIAVTGAALIRAVSDRSRLGFGLAAGAIAGWLWQPCVGEHFAAVLNRAETDRAISLLQMHVYVIGLSLPILLVVAVPLAFPQARNLAHHRRVRAGAGMLTLAYAATVTAGRYDDVVGELFRISAS